MQHRIGNRKVGDIGNARGPPVLHVRGECSCRCQVDCPAQPIRTVPVVVACSYWLKHCQFCTSSNLGHSVHLRAEHHEYDAALPGCGALPCQANPWSSAAQANLGWPTCVMQAGALQVWLLQLTGHIYTKHTLSTHRLCCQRLSSCTSMHKTYTQHMCCT
jgi:hypothetical protein